MATIKSADGFDIAYEHLPGTGPGILFLTGFNSNMNGDKALALRAWCEAQGRQFTRFDYFGHGQSQGAFVDGTLGRWIDDALLILDKVSSGPQLLVGSSMGGWVMLRVALARPERVKALLGLAAAPDFTEGMLTGGLSAQQLMAMGRDGYCDIDNCYDDGEPYRISRALLEEGQAHRVLNQETLSIDKPVRLIHGQCDVDVPWQRSLLLAEKLSSQNVEVQLIKNGDHRLSTPHDLDRMLNTLSALLAAPEIIHD